MIDKFKVYVDIQSLLDLNAGSMINLYGSTNDVVSDLIKGKYHSRPVDDFSMIVDYIDTSIVVNDIKSRNIESLQKSCMTNVITLIIDVVKGFELNNCKVDVREVELVLNTMGFELTNEEVDDFKSVLIEFMPTITPVIVNIDIRELTPSYIHNSFDVLFMYDFNNWFTLHGESLPKKPIPDIQVITPALFVDRVPTDKEGTLDSNPDMTPFEVLEKTLAEFIKLHMIDVVHFSFIKK